VKKVIFVALISLLLLDAGCGGGNKGGGEKVRDGMQVSLVTSSAGVSNNQSSSKIISKYNASGSTNQFFGVANNGYVKVFNEFQITSFGVGGVDILDKTVDADYTWHLVSSPTGVPDGDDTIDTGKNIYYEKTEQADLGKYRLRVDFHDINGVYPDQSLNMVLVFYSGFGLANPAHIEDPVLTGSNHIGYKFDPDGLLIPADTNLADADIYLGNRDSSDDANYIFAPNGIVKISDNYEDTLSVIDIDPTKYNFTDKKIDISYLPSNANGLFLVKCKNGFAKFGIFASSNYQAHIVELIRGWVEYTKTNSFINFD
jgi:hypothetical protein